MITYFLSCCYKGNFLVLATEILIQGSRGVRIEGEVSEEERTKCERENGRRWGRCCGKWLENIYRKPRLLTRADPPMNCKPGISVIHGAQQLLPLQKCLHFPNTSGMYVLHGAFLYLNVYFMHFGGCEINWRALHRKQL